MSFLQKILVSTAAVSLLSIGITTTVQAQEASFPYEQTFTITAYYSPIPGQTRYIRGSLEKDRKLNGNGTNGADGTPVFPGMIAAPKSIPFGTKMSIPGIGEVSVHDRGGAIVPAGQRGEKFDRLDVWMGEGDQGLNRALAWGRRNVTVKVWGIDDARSTQVDLSALDQLSQKISTTNTVSSLFTQNLGLGDSGEQVKILQTNLAKLQYYSGEINGIFDSNTYQAVLKFQTIYEIIDSTDDFGAGYFGPQTRRKLEQALQGLNPTLNHQKDLQPESILTPLGEIKVASAAPANDLSTKIALAGNGLVFLNQDLKLGDSGEAVLQLQTELKKLNLFGIEPTGFYGDLTAHAVFKFQQTQGLVDNKDSVGAGEFGPITRSKISSIVNGRIDTRQQIAIRTGSVVALNQ